MYNDFTEEKKLKKRLWRLLEKYGIWQDYKFGLWKRDLRDEFWRDFLKLMDSIERKRGEKIYFISTNDKNNLTRFS